MARYKHEVVSLTIEDAIDIFYSDITGLAEEIREVVDNAEGGLAETQRIQTLDETADTLEGLEQPDLDGEARALVFAQKIEVGISMRGSKKRGAESRATRASNAASYGRAAADAIQEFVEAEREALEEGEASDAKNEEGASDGALALTSQIRSERSDLLDELAEFANDLLEHCDEAEGVEFPGMFG